jgi:hypothetical protein
VCVCAHFRKLPPKKKNRLLDNYLNSATNYHKRL